MVRCARCVRCGVSSDRCITIRQGKYITFRSNRHTQQRTTSPPVMETISYLSGAAFVLPGLTSKRWWNLFPRCLPERNNSVSDRAYPCREKVSVAISPGECEERRMSEYYRRYERPQANYNDRMQHTPHSAIST